MQDFPQSFSNLSAPSLSPCPSPCVLVDLDRLDCLADLAWGNAHGKILHAVRISVHDTGTCHFQSFKVRVKEIINVCRGHSYQPAFGVVQVVHGWRDLTALEALLVISPFTHR